MPDKSTIEKAKKDKAEGKSANTQAGEFVHDEIEKVRKGKHGVRSAKQAIAIGLSEARRAGVKLPPPKNASEEVKKKAKADTEKARSRTPVSQTRSRARIKALKKEATLSDNQVMAIVEQAMAQQEEEDEQAQLSDIASEEKEEIVENTMQ